MALNSRSVIYNGVDLSASTNVVITDINKDDFPVRNVTDYTLARADGRKQIAAFYDNRQIIVGGVIIATDVPTFESNRATLIQNLDGQDLPLDLVIGSVQQRFFATVSTLTFSQGSGGFAVFSLTFECSSPFGIDPSLQPALATVAITTATSTKSLASLQGTYKMAPYISIYLTSGTGINATTNFMKITNPATGKYILITRAFAVGELIVVDVFNRTVTANRVNVDFTGNIDLFWAFGAGGTVQYDDNFTTRSVNLTFQGYPRYL